MQHGNFQIILGLKPSDKILVIGSNKIAEQYKLLFFPIDLCTGTRYPVKKKVKYSCLLIDMRMPAHRRHLRQELSFASKLLTDDGVLVLLTKKHTVTKRLLANIFGHNHVTTFLPFPRGDRVAEEYPRIGSTSLTNIHEYGWWTCLLQRLGIYNFFHNKYFVISSSKSLEDNKFLKNISDSLESYVGEKCSIRIERFDARLRGTLIVFITEIKTGHRLIVRIVSDEYTNLIVRKNQQFLKMLHSNSRLQDGVKDVLPKIISEINWHGSTAYIEECLSGVLAWKLVNKNNSNIFFSEALHFLQNFNQSTTVVKIIDDDIWVHLFSEDERRFSKSIVKPGLQKYIYGLLRKIKSNIDGKKYTLVASHGDFGYGNILFAPRSRKLTGVIDWDTGKTLEFAGVDFFNLLIQHGRTLGLSLVDSVKNIMEELISDPLPGTWDNYLQPYAATTEERMIIFATTLLRYISRASQYEKVFLKEQEEYCKILLVYEECYNK
jgi:hypothetical protein